MKNNFGGRWGECPGLDGGPVSPEHEARFVSRAALESQSSKMVIAAPIADDIARDHAKNGEFTA